MNDDTEVPLHSSKSFARRIKNANNRLSRNNMLFSMCHDIPQPQDAK